MKLTYSLNFEEKLEEIIKYISKDSENNAEGFKINVYDKIKGLKQFPKLGSLTHDNLRKLTIHKNYTIYYKIQSTTILILTIKHVKKK